MNKIAIIGGGASGLMAALTAARAGADVTLYEHNQSVGKKILASGNGRCNIINTVATANDYAGENPSFVTFALKQLSFHYFEKLCRSVGLILDVKEDGRCYPLSNEAKSVLIALTSAVENAGAKIVTQTRVTALSKNAKTFIVESTAGKEAYNRVLIATGSEAAPQLGATSDGYALAASFGHTLLPAYPSLVQLHAKTPPKMAGVKTYGKATLLIDGKAAVEAAGDILFTPYGLSGLAILDISQQASQALLNKRRVAVSLNLLPRFDTQTLANTIQTLCDSVPTYRTDTLLSSLLPTKSLPFLLSDTAIAADTLASALSPKDIKRLSHRIHDWRFDVHDTHGFKHAEVSGGGVSTAEINPKTMESTRISGLFFAGEVIDVVGRRGGFNFHFAWASGMIAGKEMAK